MLGQIWSQSGQLSNWLVQKSTTLKMGKNQSYCWLVTKLIYFMRGGVPFKACIWGSLKWKFSEPGLIWGPACMPMQNGTWLVKVKIYIWEPKRQHCITKRTNTQRRKVGTFTQGYHLHPIYLYPYTSPLCTSFLLWFLLPLNLQDIPEISFEGDGDIFINQARVLWRINVIFLCTDAEMLVSIWLTVYRLDLDFVTQRLQFSIQTQLPEVNIELN